MEEQIKCQVKEDLEYYKSREKTLEDFELELNKSNLPSEIKRRIILEVKKEIEICETEIEQLIVELGIDEEIEMKADLENKYQENIKAKG